jgi:hypothetical protein
LTRIGANDLSLIIASKRQAEVGLADRRRAENDG